MLDALQIHNFMASWYGNFKATSQLVYCSASFSFFSFLFAGNEVNHDFIGIVESKFTITTQFFYSFSL